MFARFATLSLLCTTLGVLVLGTQELNSESFAKLTAKDYGKNGMIKFFQPWCVHGSIFYGVPWTDRLVEGSLQGGWLLSDLFYSCPCYCMIIPISS